MISKPNFLFNVEEENVTAIYHGKTRTGAMTSMLNEAKNIEDEDMRKVITSAVTKLGLLMTDDEFEKTRFTFTEYNEKVMHHICGVSPLFLCKYVKNTRKTQ